MTPVRITLWLLNALLVVVTAGLMVAGVTQLLVKNRPAPLSLADRADVRQAVVDAAASNTAKILTYSPDTVEQDFATALTHTTGAFADYYKKFTDETVIPAARERGIKATATVVQSGFVSFDPDGKVTTLVFVNQVTTSRTDPTPTSTASAARVGLRNISGEWLIESFDPV